MLLNRVGDFALLLAIFFIVIYFKSVEYSTVCVLTPFFKYASVYFLGCNIYLLKIITLLLFIGAVGKSAQLLLHTWLPDAMEGECSLNSKFTENIWHK